MVGLVVTPAAGLGSAVVSGEPHGIVVVPSAGIGEQIALTAWERRLILPRYEEDQARAFIAAFLGRVGH